MFLVRVRIARHGERSATGSVYRSARQLDVSASYDLPGMLIHRRDHLGISSVLISRLNETESRIVIPDGTGGESARREEI